MGIRQRSIKPKLYALFLEGALKVTCKVSRLLVGREYREIVFCDDDLGSSAQERGQPRKRPYAEYIGRKRRIFGVRIRVVIRRDALECKGKQPQKDDSPFQRNEWRDG